MVVGVPVHPSVQPLALQCFLLFVLCREEANVLKAKVVLYTKDFVTAAPLGQASGCTIQPQVLGLSLLGCVSIFWWNMVHYF